MLTIKNKNSKRYLPFLPNKKLGQCFLLDKNLLQKIANYCPVDENTIVIEIGSGYGQLTYFLANSNCHKLISYEKDQRLFTWLQNNWANKTENNLQENKVLFLNKDVLEINWEELVKEYKNKNLSVSFLVVGNLPYAISNLLIKKLLDQSHLFKGFIFLVQKEVGQRWTATPSRYKKDYSALSVYIGTLAEASFLLGIPRQCFSPSPLVDGSLIYLKPKKDLAVKASELNKFFSLVRNCFLHRRKTLWNNLLIASVKEQRITRTFQELGYDSKLRSQDLSVLDFTNLYYWLQKCNFP